MNKTPGPGNYEHDINFNEKSPVWSLSKSARDYSPNEKNFNLGPGQYDHPVGYKKVIGTAPSYGFDGKSQKLKYDISQVPGPGTYERPLMKSRKSIKIAEKLKDMENMKVPGPGVLFAPILVIRTVQVRQRLLGQRQRPVFHFQGLTTEAKHYLCARTRRIREQIDSDQVAQGKGDFRKRRKAEVRFGSSSRPRPLRAQANLRRCA